MKKKIHDLILEHIAKLVVAGVVSFIGYVAWSVFVTTPALQANDKNQDSKIDKLIVVNCRMAILEHQDDSVILEVCNK